MKVVIAHLGTIAIGVALEQVREVVAFPHLMPLPAQKKSLLGLMSLRQSVIAVIDLRIMFKLIPTLTEDTSVIICKHGSSSVGLVVDSILQVTEFSEEQMSKIDLVATNEELDRGLAGVLRLEQGLVLFLDVEKLVDQDQVQVPTQLLSRAS